MHILPDIAQYLLLHQQVAIAGVGVITLTHKNGFFDVPSNTFYPPCYKLSFYKKEVQNSNLVQYIGAQNNDNFSHAEQEIANLAQQILSEINRHSVENISELHTFSYLAQLEAEVNKRFYGLNPLKIDSLALTLTKSFIQINESEAVNKSTLTQHQNYNFPLSYSLAEQALQTAHNKESEYVSQNTFSWFWFLAAILVVITTLIIAITLYYFPPFATSQPKTPTHQNVSIRVNTLNKKSIL
ncbi:MAG: hypothetical protein EAZ51_09130 [Sphingobacteriales bacterium]|nr:MAG: hypothetical protein EAZ64_03215 [Sphingobacteriales bacterium]TAF78623.1 MAG: hypothetical protein EAZ51_09130 [Sphingobacteriales bacterium]